MQELKLKSKFKWLEIKCLEKIGKAGLFTLLMFAMAGCPSPKDDDAGLDPNRPPTTREEALARLSAAHRQNFANWEQKILKSCDVGSALGLASLREGESVMGTSAAGSSSALTSEGVDGRVLLKMNDSSLIFADPENFVLLTEVSGMSGQSESESSYAASAGEQKYEVSGRAVRKGGECTVFLYGQEVYKTYLAQEITVGLEWHPNKLAQTHSATPPNVKALGVDPASAEVVWPQLLELMGESLDPTENGLEFLRGKLDLTREQIRSYFKLKNHSIRYGTLKMAQEASAIWSYAGHKNIIAHEQSLSAIFNGLDKMVPFDFRLQIPQVNFAGVKNEKDTGHLRFTFDVNVFLSDSRLNFSTAALDLEGLAAYDPAEAAACVQDRAGAYIGSGQEFALRPTVRVLFAPCILFQGKEWPVASQDQLLKPMLADILAGVLPSVNMDYGGWDMVLGRWLTDIMARKASLQLELDPTAKTQIIGSLAIQSEAISDGLRVGAKDSLNLANELYRMGLTWVLQARSVSDASLTRILEAVEKSARPFLVSTRGLIQDLGTFPFQRLGDLVFIESMSPIYEQEAERALAISKDIGYLGFERSIFDRIIQLKTSLPDLRGWTKNLRAIRTALLKGANLGSIREELIGESIKWLESGAVSQASLSVIYSDLSNVIAPFEKSTKTLMRDLSQSLETHRSTLVYARGLSKAFKAMAVDIRDKATQIQMEAWANNFFDTILQIKPTSRQLLLWADMWDGALAFTQREAARIGTDSPVVNEWNRKKIIERAVGEEWGKADFMALEQISQLALFMARCEHYKGASSLADCASLELFSKAEGRFFDVKYNGRYGPKSAAFQQLLRPLNGFDWGNLRRSLTSAFFGFNDIIWSKCTDARFDVKLTQLSTQIKAIQVEPDQIKRWNLEREIDKTLENCL